MKASLLGLFRSLRLGCLLFLWLSCSDSGPKVTRHALTVEVAGQPRTTFTSDELLRHPAAHSLVVANSPAYPQLELKVKAIPVKELVPVDRGSGMNVIFECLDGFAASIPADRVLGADDAEAFLAIEDPTSPWPPLAKDPTHTAGPIYLVWKRALRNTVVPEEWPYQVTRITTKDAPEKEFPGIAPDPTVAPGSPVQRGFQVFVRHCFACHTLNGLGDGRVGPDLNVPMNPTEYFQVGILKQYLRDPRSVREWPGQRMPSFSEDSLREDDLNDLCTYLDHMARRKP